MKLPVLLTALLLLLALSLRAAQPTGSSDVEALIPWLLREDGALKDIPFSDVIAATSGKKIIPIDASDKAVLDKIGKSMDAVLAKMNAPDSPVRGIRRINEVSSHFEDLMKSTLNAGPDLSCDFPRTEEGRVQRSGYPDLRLIEKTSGKVFYLDPKLYAKGSRGSSFRTFYFEPKKATNKVNDHARHLIVGIEHDRDASGRWRFLRWELIDLSKFRVKLKAEFEGSNRDMYRKEAVVASGPE